MSPGDLRAFDMGQPVNAYRSASGMPGVDYWQNKADYTIHATLDEKGPVLSAVEEIGYTNNSPDTLDVLWPSSTRTPTRPTAAPPIPAAARA